MIIQSNSNKKKWGGDKAHYKAVLIKTASYWHKIWYSDQRNRIECSKTRPHTYSKRNFDRNVPPHISKNKLSISGTSNTRYIYGEE